MKKPASVLDNLSDEEMAAVIQRIIYLRSNISHMTQAEFSKIIGVSQTYISLLEAGRKPLTFSAYNKIVVSFKVSPNWLLYGNGDHVFNSQEPSKPKMFVEWYQNLPYEDQCAIADAVETISDIVIHYPPGT